MELADFVKTTLVEIITGIEGAISETAGAGRAVINPTVAHANHATPEMVKFDVALTVKDTASGQTGIKVAEIELSDRKSEKTQEAISRISFAIPVAWPSVAKEQYGGSAAFTTRQARTSF